MQRRDITGAFFEYSEQEPFALDPACHPCQMGGQEQGGLFCFPGEPLVLDPIVKEQHPQCMHMPVHQNPNTQNVGFTSKSAPVALPRLSILIDYYVSISHV